MVNLRKRIISVTASMRRIAKIDMHYNRVRCDLYEPDVSQVRWAIQQQILNKVYI